MLKEISPATATPFGDMTDYGGLAAAFNGILFKDGCDCAGKNAATSAFAGLIDSVPRKIAKVEIRGSEDYGYCGSTKVSITFNLRASQTFPTDESDGQLLGSITITNYNGENPLGHRIRSIYSNDIDTVWAHRWVEQVTAAPTTMLRGLDRYFEPYAVETVTDGPQGAFAVIEGLRADSDGGDNSKMWVSADRAILVSPIDGTTKALRTPMNFRCAELPAGLSAGQTVWAWLVWGPTIGMQAIFDPAPPTSSPTMPPGATHVCHAYPVVLGPDAKIRSADHPVHVKDDTFFYTSGDFVNFLDAPEFPQYDAPIDLSGYAPAGAYEARTFFDPEIRTGNGYGYCGFIPKTGEGGNFAIVMVYGMAAIGAFEAQCTFDIPLNDERTITYQIIDPVGPITRYICGYQLQSYRF